MPEAKQTRTNSRNDTYPMNIYSWFPNYWSATKKHCHWNTWLVWINNFGCFIFQAKRCCEERNMQRKSNYEWSSVNVEIMTIFQWQWPVVSSGLWCFLVWWISFFPLFSLKICLPLTVLFYFCPPSTHAPPVLSYFTHLSLCWLIPFVKWEAGLPVYHLHW